MKLCQNVFLGDISEELETGPPQFKNQLAGQILEKPSVGCRGHFFPSDTHET